MNAIWETVAPNLTIEWKSFITRKSTRLSSARVTLGESSLVTMAICAHSPILKRKSLWTCCTNSRPTVRITSIRQISTFFTLRQSGVPILMPSIPEMHASMRITGKISGGNLMCLIMSENNVLSGRLNISFKHMRMAAKTSTDASSLMDGKSRSIIL